LFKVEAYEIVEKVTVPTIRSNAGIEERTKKIFWRSGLFIEVSTEYRIKAFSIITLNIHYEICSDALTLLLTKIIL